MRVIIEGFRLLSKGLCVTICGNLHVLNRLLAGLLRDMKNETFPVSLSRLYKSADDPFKLLNAAVLWISF